MSMKEITTEEMRQVEGGLIGALIFFAAALAIEYAVECYVT
jgi:bacteriocin-like protein